MGISTLALVGILAVFAIVIIGGIWMVTQQFAPTPTVEITEAEKIAACPGDVQPSLTLSAVDVYNPGTAHVTNWLYREVGTEAWTGSGTAASSSVSSINYDPGTKIEIAAGADNTTANGPVGTKLTFTVPCTSYPTAELKVPVASSNSVTTTAWNEDGTVSSATNVQGTSAGDVKSMEFRMVGVYEQDYGARQAGDFSNVLTMKYNSTCIDDLEIKYVTGGNIMLETAGTPVQDAAAAGYLKESFKFPVLKTNDRHDFVIAIDIDDTNACAVSANSTSLTGTLYDSQLYLDSDDNTLKFGVEDENNADVGIGTEETIIFYIGS